MNEQGSVIEMLSYHKKDGRYLSGQGSCSERDLVSDTEKDSERLQELLCVPISIQILYEISEIILPGYFPDLQA